MAIALHYLIEGRPSDEMMDVAVMMNRVYQQSDCAWNNIGDYSHKHDSAHDDTSTNPHHHGWKSSWCVKHLRTECFESLCVEIVHRDGAPERK
jgi:hypothetical protein